MQPIEYQFDDARDEWNILVLGKVMTTTEFMDYVWRFLTTKDIALSNQEHRDVMGHDCDQIHAVKSSVVTGKNAQGHIIKTPAMLSSWVRINLDYAQSAVFCRTAHWARIGYRDAPETLPEDMSLEEAIDHAAKARLMEFSVYLTGDDKLFGDLVDRKKKRKKR